MSSIYGLKFGSGDPRDYTGLTPTFLIYKTQGGTNISAPSVAEVGTSTGLYCFTAAPSATYTIFFLVDGGSSITDASLRYLTGTIDPIANVDQQLGFSASSYGTTVRPTNVFGLVKRLVEYLEGDANFNKTSGAWNTYAKGTSTLLVSKTLANNTTQTTKT